MAIAEKEKTPKVKRAKPTENTTATSTTIVGKPVEVKKKKTAPKVEVAEKPATSKVKKISSKLGLSKAFDPVIIEKLKAIISPYTEHPELLKKIEKETNVNFVEKLNIDSVDVVEIVVDVEQEFNITIEDKEIETFKTFEDMYNLIEAKINAAKAS